MALGPAAIKDDAQALVELSLVPSRIPSTHPLHRPRSLTADERERYRQMARRSRAQSRLAADGQLDALHAPNKPVLDPGELMPETPSHGLRSLSLYSGGGGLDVAFERAGFEHVASYELLEHAANTLRRNRPDWDVYGADAGDVTKVDLSHHHGDVDVLHGGPPCQPFSNAGRQEGRLDPRDCWPATVRAIKRVQPLAFVAENVPALNGKKFVEYVDQVITGPLSRGRRPYYVRKFVLEAKDFGVPQIRRRVFFVGFRYKKAFDRFEPPRPTHYWQQSEDARLLFPTMGARAALGLPVTDELEDGLAPTIRSGLTGPRFTTSICNSTSAARAWASLGLWPNGVAFSREAASRFPTDTGAFRLSVADVALLQGFPLDWTWPTAVYQAVGQIGNAVPPPMAWAVADAIRAALMPD